MSYNRIAISSGHCKHVTGAVGPSPWELHEVNEARRVVEQVAAVLETMGVTVATFHDDVSRSQSENLDRIVDWHDDQDRELDVSVHFNAFEVTEAARGTECLYLTQEHLAAQMALAISECGFINRGAKRTDLAFLNGTDEPAILIEVAFVDSHADADLYRQRFSQVCDAIAGVISGVDVAVPPEPVEPPVAKPLVAVAISVPANVDISVTVNGIGVLLGDD